MMKTLNDYLAMSYRMEIVEAKDGGGFVVSLTCQEQPKSKKNGLFSDFLTCL